MKVDKSKQNKNLTRRQLSAIPIILSASTITEGLERARVSRAAFYKWITEPAFKAELERRRREVVDSALHELKISAYEAVRVLRELLYSENERIRLKTAISFLDHISKFIEFEEMESRLQILEARILN